MPVQEDLSGGAGQEAAAIQLIERGGDEEKTEKILRKNNPQETTVSLMEKTEADWKDEIRLNNLDINETQTGKIYMNMYLRWYTSNIVMRTCLQNTNIFQLARSEHFDNFENTQYENL